MSNEYGFYPFTKDPDQQDYEDYKDDAFRGYRSWVTARLGMVPANR